jgi:hypothetical protein
LSLNALNVARIAKLVALLGFLFPWVLVSCSGQPVGRLTGIDLATGGLTVTDSALQHQHGDPNIWVIAALAATISGLIVSFVFRGRGAAAGMGGLALVALAASGIGVASAASAAPSDPLRPPPGSAEAAPDDGSGATEVNLQYGYFITVAGLLVAVGACGAALAGRGTGGRSSLGP